MISKVKTLSTLLSILLLQSGHSAGWYESYIDTIPLVSKEYKVSLKPEHFKNGEEDVERFRQLFEELLKPGQLTKSYRGKGRDKKKTRHVSFYDTKGSCILKNNGYSLRERLAYEVGERWLNIKYRSRDIEESGDRNMDDHQKQGIKKFEEDLVGIDSIYSHSNKVLIDNSIEIASKALTVFPTLKRSGLTPSHKLVKVGNYIAREYNYIIAKVRFDNRYQKDDPSSHQFEKQSIRKIELTLWYVDDQDAPIMAEVTWKIRDKDGNYHQESVQNGNNLFNQLKVLPVWVDPNPEPKTLMIYAHSVGFCDTAAKISAWQDTTILSLVETIQVTPQGGAQVKTEVMLKGAKDQTILLPLNFREAKNVTGTIPISPVRVNGTWYFKIKLDGSSNISYQYDVDRYMDWRIGLDLDGFPNIAVKGHQNVMVKYKFTNTSVHKINNYRLKLRIPEGYAISRIAGVAPKKIKKVDPDRFVLVPGGVDVGYTQGEAIHETQAFALTTGKYAGITLFIRPSSKGWLVLLVGLSLVIIWLVGNREILK